MLFAVGDSTTSSILNSDIVSELGSLMTTITGWITSNSVLVIFLTLSFVGVGIGVFRSLKNAI